MKKIIFISALIVLVGCSSDTEEKKQKPTQTKEVKEKSKQILPRHKSKVLSDIGKTRKPSSTLVATEVTKHEKTAQEIFMTCAACHGKNAEKVAMGKSKIIRGWDSAKVVTALNGYKTGTYGGAMKGLMKGQVSKLSDEDINKVSKYISTL